MPVVVVVGARQTGKSTLVRHIAPDHRYLTLDDLDILDQARRDPDSLLTDPPLILDEVQRAPELLLAIKRRVDIARRPGDFLLTGSAQFALMKNVADSLAGRAVYLELSPFCPLEWVATSRAEALIESLFSMESPISLWQKYAGEEDWKGWMLRGGFAPAIEIADPSDRAIWFGGYVQTYMERDLRELSVVNSLADFQRMMRIAAHRTGRLLNQSEIARDAGLAQATCHRYLNLLETGFQITRLQPYTVNPATALVKSPKLYWGDTGLAAWLAGIHRISDIEKRDDRGFWLEQAVFQTLQAWCGNDSVRRRVSTWRTRGGEEVDFILEQDRKCVAIEIKTGCRVRMDDTRALRSFAASIKKTDTFVRGVVLHGGDTARPLANDILALPHAPLFPEIAEIF